MPSVAVRESADISVNVKLYLGKRARDERFSSFDYCFNHFRSLQQGDLAKALDAPRQMELACLQLGFYLASWGMYRGSGQLIHHSARRLVPTVEAIVRAPSDIWSIDSVDYNDRAQETILSVAEDLRPTLPGSASDTLVTKIMLGVFGCVPALDSYFVRGFGIGSSRPLRISTLAAIGEYSAVHRDQLKTQCINTLDFASGSETSRRYTTAKIIDMVFFVHGSGSA
jgi:hypothetical protein